MCVHCRHELAWYDLLPVVSWLSLGGKCRYCRRPISWQYPVVELLTAGLFLLSYIAWPYGFDEPTGTVLFALWLVFLVGFVALAVYDIRWMLLPNRIVYPLIALAVAQVIIKAASTGGAAGTIGGAALGFLTIGGLFFALFQVSGGKWMGGGDVKLAFMIGPLVGSGVLSMMVIFFASVLGTLVSAPFLAQRTLKANSRIPFGPFLIAATVVVYLFGGRILDWYTQGLL